MGTWDRYENRINNRGGDLRGSVKRQALYHIGRHVPENLSYFTVAIDGEKQDVSIINSDNLNEKSILSMPGQDIHCGSLVEWMDNRWLVTERDANTTLYTKAKMLQCNYLLKWIDTNAQIHEQWCVIEDGTKYLTGEFENREYIVARGDSRIAITIGKNQYTSVLNRESRFIVDDENSTMPMVYILSKPMKIGHTYNDEGVFIFVLQEVVSTDNDNFELGVADYYKYYPKRPVIGDQETEAPAKKVWF